MYSKSNQGDPKVYKVIPILPQTHPKVPPKCPKLAPKCPKVAPKWLPSDTTVPQSSPKVLLSDSKVPHQAPTYTHHTCHLMLFDVELAQISFHSPPIY